MKNIYKIIFSIVGLSLLVAVVIISFRVFTKIENAVEERRQTSLVISLTENLLSELKDAETGQRGYLLTGDETFLEPYNEVHDTVSKHLDELRNKTLIDSARERLNLMIPLITDKMTEMEDVINLRRKHELTAAIEVVRIGQGKKLMDLIRIEKNSFIQIEEDALAKHEADLKSVLGILFIVIVAMNILLILFVFIFAYFIYREAQHRLKHLVHLETKHLLEIQENTNKQMQQVNTTLQVSEEKLTVTLNSIGDAVMATDAEGKVTLLNPLAEQLTGWTQAEAIGRHVEEIFCIINGKTRQPVPVPVRDTLTHGLTSKVMDKHTVLISRNGDECAIDDSCAPIRSRDKEVIGAVLVFRDITKGQELGDGLEKAIRELDAIKMIEDEAREYSESIIDTVREPLIVLDQNLRVVTASRSFYEVFKVNPEETMGQLIYDLGNKQWDIPKLRELLETILPQKTTFDNYEVEHDFATIGKRLMLLNARQIQRVMGKERIILLAIEDITVRREIENGLEKVRIELAAIKISEDEAREYSENIIDTVREPLIVLDQNLRVVTASRSFYEVFKVNPEETVEQLIYDLGNKQWDIPKLRELLETILPQKTTFDNYEVEHDFATIGKRLMLLNARQIQRVKGKERIILLAIEDITVRREIENGLGKAHEELEELATELKRSTLAKSEFLANMSHELRTPLNSINGFSEVLYDETFGSLNEKQKKYVHNVLTSGKHLLMLINQILDMAKVEAGKMQLAISSIHLKNILNDFSMLLADMVSKKNIEMLLEIDEDLPNIEADELKVKEVIYNLLSNAVKFTPNGGRLGMRAKKNDSMIEIVVWDTGIGIAVENMKKIFEGFFRVDTPYSRITEGTGLGLPLSRKLVELHGGKLSLESEGLDRGTSVLITFPIVHGGDI